MNERMDRRQALAVLGTVSPSGLLAACGDDNGGDGGTTVKTQAGTTAMVEPKADASRSMVELLDRSGSCALSPEETEGPYYIDVDSIRRDVRDGRPGTPLRLGVRVREAESCDPIEDAVVEIWHCDASGVYSGFESGANETFLRGGQVTNAKGIAELLTVYPGWYQGRTAHIHTKVHLDNRTLLTSQLYFDEDVTAAVYKRTPYSRRSGRDTFNTNDQIFDEELLLSLARSGNGYLGAISLDVAKA
jgi:protocatechuate 3,4-dioxygenase beta subunit